MITCTSQNAHFGYDAGEVVISQMCQCLKSNQKSLDTCGKFMIIGHVLAISLTSQPAHVVAFSISSQIVEAVSLLLGTSALTSRANTDPAPNKDTMFMVPIEFGREFNYKFHKL
jgi:hypothetical protein